MAQDGIRRVVCAANRNPKGKVVLGARHWDAWMRDQILRPRFFLFGRPVRPRSWRHAEQGFIDQFGVFMTREEAWDVAFAAGQVIFQKHTQPGVLYSEDIY